MSRRINPYLLKHFSVNNIHAIFGCRTKRVFREVYNQFVFYKCFQRKFQAKTVSDFRMLPLVILFQKFVLSKAVKIWYEHRGCSNQRYLYSFFMEKVPFYISTQTLPLNSKIASGVTRKLHVLPPLGIHSFTM